MSDGRGIVVSGVGSTGGEISPRWMAKFVSKVAVVLSSSKSNACWKLSSRRKDEPESNENGSSTPALLHDSVSKSILVTARVVTNKTAGKAEAHGRDYVTRCGNKQA